MNYDLMLQTAVNEMVQQIWDTDALFVLSLQCDKDDFPVLPIFLDFSTLAGLDFTANGLQLVLYTPGRSSFEVDIAYNKIKEIIGYYGNFNLARTLYYKRIV